MMDWTVQWKPCQQRFEVLGYRPNLKSRQPRTWTTLNKTTIRLLDVWEDLLFMIVTELLVRNLHPAFVSALNLGITLAS